MARLGRYFLPGQPLHVIQRGNDRANDERGPVYSVRIKPLVNLIFADGREVALTPGMAVTAKIKTGKRRVISYLLDPVARYWGEGLREG
jgi:hemolysin D